MFVHPRIVIRGESPSSYSSPLFFFSGSWLVWLSGCVVSWVLGILLGFAMPLPKQVFELNTGYVGRGFWFAIGFTPVFLLLSWLAMSLYVHLSIRGADEFFTQETQRLFFERQRMQSEANAIAHAAIAPAVNSFRAMAPPVEPSHAEIGPARQLTQAERQERECSQLMLQFSETQDPDVKEQMYRVCP